MIGMFITFEGGEGVGKTTQITLLKDALEADGRTVVVTREPGGTPIAERIRNVVLDAANAGMAPMTELLLYEAARAQHVEELIRPALERGDIVLCDRFSDSTTAYQGAGRSLNEADLETLHALATGGLEPDLTILLDLAPTMGLERASHRGEADRIELESITFHERVREGFLELAARYPERLRVVDATQDVETIAAEVLDQVRTKMGS